MTDQVYWILKADIKAGRLEALREVAAAFSTLTRKETGAVAYEWSLTPDETGLHVYERFEDSHAVLTHLENVGPVMPDLLECVEFTVIECYGRVSDGVKTAMAELPMVYHTQIAGFHR